MKQLIFICFLLQNYVLFAQTKEPVYYFTINDSLLGVKDRKGKIIIPARNWIIDDIKNGERVADGLINLIEANDTSSDRRKSFGKTYNHKGEFLYRPYSFDNGPDELHEGLSRFVENGKIGFVNRHGKKIIPAQFDYADWFGLGTAMFCTGCYFDTKKDPEHPPLKGGTYGMIDRNGKILINNISGSDRTAIWKITDSLSLAYYPTLFRYSAFEQTLIGKLNPYKKAIQKEYFSNTSGATLPQSLMFDITEKPSGDFPYYVITSREVIGKEIHAGLWDELKFYISKDGTKMYFINYDEQLVPFLKWYNIYIKGGRDYD